MFSTTLTYLFFFIGFPALIGGAHFLVEGSSSIARKLGVSDLVIGLTIVAFGTSAPELLVSVLSAFSGSTDLAIGNVVGSNISNILMILGIAVIISPLQMRKGLRFREIPFVLLSALILVALANDHILDGRNFSEIDRSDGLAMLGFLAIFFYFTAAVARKGDEGSVDHPQSVSTPLALLMIIGGGIGLALGGQWIVDGAVKIASVFGVSEALIGLTIISIGTSLPELATSVVAARKGNADMAIGNIIGSNIMNIFWILGMTALVTPLHFNIMLNTDIWFMVGATVLFFFSTFTWKKHRIDRIEGILFLSLYVGYIGFLVWRG